jgi:urease accessory protein
MTDARPLLALAAFFSPSFPTGAFAYSSGLETAAATGAAADTQTMREWLETQLSHGAFRNDAILFAAAWRTAADGTRLAEIGELAAALCGSLERHGEAMNQGRAFLAAAGAWLAKAALPKGDLPIAVAAGACCAGAGIALEAALPVFIQGQVSNQLQAAIRLSLTGQNGAAGLLADLSGAVEGLALFAASSSLDDLGSAALLAEIAVLNHETLGTRLFLS